MRARLNQLACHLRRVQDEALCFQTAEPNAELQAIKLFSV
jgi:hypothetical protein